MSRVVLHCLLIASCAALSSGSAIAQPPRQEALQFNSQTPLPLDTVIRFISARMKMRFIYTDEIGNRRINLRTPPDVPPNSLFPIFSAALRTANLAIVDAEVPGWKRIIDAKDLPLFASQRSPQDIINTDGTAAPATKSFQLRYINAQQVSQVIKPFLSKIGSNVLALSDSNVLVVTDYASTVQMIEKLITLLDVPTRDVTYEFYAVRNMSSKTLVEQAKSLLQRDGTASRGARGTGGSPRQSKQIEILDDSRANRAVVVGGKELLTDVVELLRRLDVALGFRTRVYRVQNLTAERLDRVIKGLLPPQDEQNYKATVDEDGNLLVVRATDLIHKRVLELLSELDRPVQDAESPIRFYKLRNARAPEVLSTLLALQEAYGTGGINGFNPYGGGLGLNPLQGGQSFFPGGGQFGAPGIGGFGRGGNMGGVPGSTFGGNRGQGNSNLTNQMPPGVENTASTPLRQRSNEDQAALRQNSQLSFGFGGAQQAAVLPGGARVSADVGTNSLIVVAPAGVQQMYANLIKSLDQRRPQVLIEAKIVAVDTSDNFALGVEVSTGDRVGAERLFQFTSFGLSEVDRTTGALSILPAVGFNGTLVDPDVADVVVQALAGHARARVLSVPKVLVNDNTTGQLESVVSVPFQSVNASDTVSTTSLGGNQSAGTIISVTPHINEDDNLQLEFEVEFSTFSGSSINGLPPPRQVDRVSSTVTIPDGQTVIVGGLKRNSTAGSFTGVPWLERIPVVRDLTGRSTEEQTTTSFFLFIRPLILRDSRFGDLRFVSNRDKQAAEIPSQYPSSRPVLMR